MSLLENRTAVVTGGAQGIGLAIARLYVEHGARVVIGDLDEAAAKAAADGARLRPARSACAATWSTPSRSRRLVADRGRPTSAALDVFVNNAGITRDATMRTMTEEDFDLVIQVHLKGTWNGTRLAAARMREQKSGAIVNISSLSGKVGMVGQTNYSAAKAGIVGMTKAAAKEMAHHGVRVNAIQPGLIRSAMTEAMPQKAWDQKMAEIPMRPPRRARRGRLGGAVLRLATSPPT